MIALGSQAPDFNLKDQNKKVINLQQLKGKMVILSFRPLAWTPICHDQMLSLERNFAFFEKHNTVALGVGVDSVPSNKAWANSMGIQKTQLLSDFWPHGEVSRAYGLFREGEGVSERANVILDESQKVVFARLYPNAQLPDIEELKIFIAQKRP